MPVRSATCDIVTARSPCSDTSRSVTSSVASRTERRCASIVSFHSFGTTQWYEATIVRHYGLTATECIDKSDAVERERTPRKELWERDADDEVRSPNPDGER